VLIGRWVRSIRSQWRSAELLLLEGALGNKHPPKDFFWLFARCAIVFLTTSEKSVRIICNAGNASLGRLEFSTGYPSRG